MKKTKEQSQTMGLLKLNQAQIHIYSSYGLKQNENKRMTRQQDQNGVSDNIYSSILSIESKDRKLRLHYNQVAPNKPKYNLTRELMKNLNSKTKGKYFTPSPAPRLPHSDLLMQKPGSNTSQEQDNIASFSSTFVNYRQSIAENKGGATTKPVVQRAHPTMSLRKPVLTPTKSDRSYSESQKYSSLRDKRGSQTAPKVKGPFTQDRNTVGGINQTKTQNYFTQPSSGNGAFQPAAPTASAVYGGKVDLSEDLDTQIFSRFWKACEQGDSKAIRYAIEKEGVSINSQNQDYDNWTALHYAVQHQQDITLIRYLLQNPQISSDMSSKTTLETPLHLSITTPSTSKYIISLLLASGSKAYIADSQGNTALHILSFQGRLDMIKMIPNLDIKRAIQLKNKSYKSPIDVTSDDSVRQYLVQFEAHDTPRQDFTQQNQVIIHDIGDQYQNEINQMLKPVSNSSAAAVTTHKRAKGKQPKMGANLHVDHHQKIIPPNFPQTQNMLQKYSQESISSYSGGGGSLYNKTQLSESNQSNNSTPSEQGRKSITTKGVLYNPMAQSYQDWKMLQQNKGSTNTSGSKQQHIHQRSLSGSNKNIGKSQSQQTLTTKKPVQQKRPNENDRQQQMMQKYQENIVPKIRVDLGSDNSASPSPSRDLGSNSAQRFKTNSNVSQQSAGKSNPSTPKSSEQYLNQNIKNLAQQLSSARKDGKSTTASQERTMQRNSSQAGTPSSKMVDSPFKQGQQQPKNQFSQYKAPDQMQVEENKISTPRHVVKKNFTEGELNPVKRSQTPVQEQEIIGPWSFVAHQLLGTGSFGEVYLVEKITDNKLYAMKVLSKQKINQQNLIRYALTERNVLTFCNHPFVVGLHYAFQTKDKLFLVLEYCPGGDLSEYLQIEKSFSEDRSKSYICEILLAIEYLHVKDIIFRDLKPDNVVLDRQGHAKLTDFGLSKEGVFNDGVAKSFCGSYAYLAPEMVRKAGHGKSVDWYLLGVLLYEFLVGEPPYYDDDKDTLFKNILNNKLELPRHLTPQCKDLLKQLLDKNPHSRLGSNGGAFEIKQHAWFKDVNWDNVMKKNLVVPKPFLLRKPNNLIQITPDLLKAKEQQRKTAFEESRKIQHVHGWSFVRPATYVDLS